VTFRRRGNLTAEPMEAVRIVECTGINPIPHNTANPVLRSLFDNGFARIDPMGIGLDVTGNCALIDRSGEPSTRIYAIGPLTRAAFWGLSLFPTSALSVTDWQTTSTPSSTRHRNQPACAIIHAARNASSTPDRPPLSRTDPARLR
jgi:uncharacterized NAD(P)/FAD-binding protein YdhS